MEEEIERNRIEFLRFMLRKLIPILIALIAATLATVFLSFPRGIIALLAIPTALSGLLAIISAIVLHFADKKMKQ